MPKEGDILPDQTLWECQQCEAQVTDRRTGQQRRCSRRTCKLPRLCWQHLAQEGWIVQRTKLPFPGQGLFTTQPRTGSFLHYEGEPLTRQQIDQRYPGDMRANWVYCEGDQCRDARSTQSGLARWINAPCRKRQPRARPAGWNRKWEVANAKFASRPRGRPYTFPIKPLSGSRLPRVSRDNPQEVLANYSGAYWQAQGGAARC